MKKVLIFLLSVTPLVLYSQNGEIAKYGRDASEILDMPITEHSLNIYLKLRLRNALKLHSDSGENKEVFDKIEKRISDSLLVYNQKQDSIERERIAEEIEQVKWDSISRVEQREFFSIESIVKNIGKEAYSKDNIEKTLGIYPSAYQTAWTFYELDDKFISIKYVGSENICIDLGFRLFGEDAVSYKKELMRTGFKYQKTFKETMLENHSQGYSNLSGAEIQRYRKFTGTEYVICDIYYERFTTFKFYRARYKK